MKLAKLPNDVERLPDTPWLDILEYVNGDNTTEGFRKIALRSLKRLTVEDAQKVLRDSDDLKTATMKDLAERYRAPLRDVLEWIVRPSTFDASDQAELEARMGRDMNAVDFLTRQAEGLKVSLGIEITVSTEDASGKSLLFRTITSSPSVVAGICRFILDQIDRHDTDGEPLEKLFPFQLCGRTACERFIYVQRFGRSLYCSDNCRVKANTAKMTKEQKAQRMRDYRAGLKRRDDENLKVARRKR